MKINIENKTAEEINFIIEAQTDKDLVNAMGYEYALPLSDGKALEIKYYGEYKKEKDYNQKIIGIKSAAYCNAMNKFPA